jgi:hypothetical protein
MLHVLPDVAHVSLLLMNAISLVLNMLHQVNGYWWTQA